MTRKEADEAQKLLLGRKYDVCAAVDANGKITTYYIAIEFDCYMELSDIKKLVTDAG